MATYVTGDTHGNGYDLADRMVKAGMKPGDTIIIAGDAGIAYGSWKSDTMPRTAEARSDIGIIIMRGNHDVRYWRNATRYDGNLRPGWHLTRPDRYGSRLLYDERYPNVLYVRDDGGLYDIDGTSILFIPGAYSIDQQWRIANWQPYEKEEQLTADEMARLDAIATSTDGERITVISHTCPHAWEDDVSAAFAKGIDQALVDKTTERWMDGIWDTVRDRCDGWYFGHYHADMDIRMTNGTARMLYHDVVRIG